MADKLFDERVLHAVESILVPLEYASNSPHNYGKCPLTIHTDTTPTQSNGSGGEVPLLQWNMPGNTIDTNVYGQSVICTMTGKNNSPLSGGAYLVFLIGGNTSPQMILDDCQFWKVVVIISRQTDNKSYFQLQYTCDQSSQNLIWEDSDGIVLEEEKLIGLNCDDKGSGMAIQGYFHVEWKPNI